MPVTPPSASRQTPPSRRVLHLEDDARDRELIRHALAEGGSPWEFIYATNRREYESAIERGRFDLILSDFTIPDFDGVAALKLARRLQPGVPFVFVSGTIGEERAVETLRHGATDYVLKTRLERLVPAVERALREADEHARREAAEQALRIAEARLRSLFENAAEGIYRATPEGGWLMVNPSLARIFGYDNPDAMLADGATVLQNLNTARERRAAFDRAAVAEGRVRGVEYQVQRRDGRMIWVFENAHLVRDPDGRTSYREGTIKNITGRKEEAEALRRSEERFREMAEHVDDIFWVRSPDGQQVLYVSPAATKLLGRTSAELCEQGRLWFDAIIPEDREMVKAAFDRLSAGESFNLEYRVQTPDGATRWLGDRGYIVRGAAGKIERALGVATDISERKRLEAELRHALKMEAIGQLAGGIAHDFNNLLTVINGHASLLLDIGDVSPATAESLQQIYAAGERATNLTRQLLLFSRKQRMHIRTVDLNEVVREMAKLLRRLIGEHIVLEFTLASAPAPIRADPGMIEQVVMNLAVNARDAMPRGGRLSLTTATVTVGAAEAPEDGAAGEYVRFQLADTGCGIAPEILPRIFEPFFTTKENGRGTGLGLATVFGIAKQHQGWITVETAVGRGTTFTVFFPLATESAPIETLPDDIPVSGGRETVLLVEDETAVREFAAAVLSRYGYRVLQAPSGVDALEVWRWHAARIELLITDLVMPDELNGLELAQRLRAEKPNLNVICTTGYDADALVPSSQPVEGIEFLRKPYPPRVLAAAVRNALNRRPHAV
jgi:two-component system, cell cycle sensor histidine kinase and response regulator CckA